MRGSGIIALALVMSIGMASAQTRKPPIAPGLPVLDRSGGIPVISEGVDYLDPAVAAKLLRDGEGVAVAYDAVDDDARPFAIGTTTAALVALLPARIIPIRVGDDDAAWRRAFAFVQRLPVRVVVILAMPGAQRKLAEAAMASMPERVFILPAGDMAKLAATNALTVAALWRDLQPVGLATADVVLAPAAATREAPASSSNTPPRTGAEAAMVAVGYFRCIDASTLRTGADVVNAFVARGQRGAPGNAPLLEVC